MHPMKLGSDPVIVKLKPEDLAGTLKSLAAKEMELSFPLNEVSLFAPKSSTEYNEKKRISAGTSISEVLSFGGTDDKNPLFLVVPEGEPHSNQMKFQN